MDFKKNKAFTAAVAFCAVVLLGGLGCCVWQLIGMSSANAAAEATERKLSRLQNRGKDFALTEKNVGVEQANEAAINAAITAKIERLTGKKTGGKETPVPAANDFFSSLTQRVADYAKTLEAKKIALADDAKFFGFGRYLSVASKPSLSADSVRVLSTEENALRRILTALTEARDAGEKALRGANLLAPDKRVFLLIKDVRRETAELAQGGGDAPASASRADELSVTPLADSAATGLYRLTSKASPRGGAPFPSLRKPNMTKALAFQVGFVAPTAVFRNFLASLSDAGDFPIFVRDVSVKPAVPAEVSSAKLRLDSPPAPLPSEEAAAQESAAATDFGIFGPAPAESDGADASVAAVPAAPEKFVVSPEALSEFLVTLEYVVPAYNLSALAEEKEEE